MENGARPSPPSCRMVRPSFEVVGLPPPPGQKIGADDDEGGGAGGRSGQGGEPNEHEAKEMWEAETLFGINKGACGCVPPGRRGVACREKESEGRVRDCARGE